MKSLYKILLLLLFCTSAVAQQGRTYFEGKELQKYEGEWIGTHGTDTFKIILQYKEKYQAAPNLLVDAIYGWHYYSKGGIVESNTIKYPLKIKDYSIQMGKSINGQIFMTFNDKNRKNGYAQISFTIIPDSNNAKAIWKIEKIVPQERHELTFVNKNGNRKTLGKQEDKTRSEITSISEWTMIKTK